MTIQGHHRSAAHPESLRRCLQLLAVIFVGICWFDVSHANTLTQHDSAGHSFHTGDRPNWVIDVAPAKTVAESGEPASYLLVDRQIRISDEPVHFYQHVVVRPETESGVDQVSELQLAFSPDYQKLVLHSLTVLREGKREQRLQPETIKLLQRETEIESKLYDGTVTALIVVDDIRVGDIIEYEYSIIGTNPVFGDKFAYGYSLGWSIPVGNMSFRVLTPKGRDIPARVYNIDLEPKRRSVGQFIERLWQRSPATAYTEEGQYPNWYVHGPWIQLSEFKDWQAVSQWAVELYDEYDKSTALDPKLSAMTQKWMSTTSSNEERIGLALDFVQNHIRYFGVEFGQNSHRPSHPNEVLERRYGDCKDKSLLLTALLRQMKIDAHPALVSNGMRRGIDRLLPSPSVFDHAIAKVSSGGNDYWLDGTLQYQRGPLAGLGTPNYERALVVKPGEKKLQQIAPRGDNDLVDIDERFVVEKFDGPAELKVVTTYRGQPAERQRARFNNTTLKEIKRGYLNYYAKWYPAIEATQDLSFEDNSDNNEFIVKEYYRLPDFWDDTEDGRYYFTLRGYGVGSYTALPQTIRRKTPLGIPHPIKIRHSSRVRYPETFSYEEKEKPEVVVDDSIGYRREVVWKQHDLHITHDYNSKADAVSAENVPGHVRKLKQINEHLYYSGWVRPEQVIDKEARRKESDRLVDELLERID